MTVDDGCNGGDGNGDDEEDGDDSEMMQYDV